MALAPKIQNLDSGLRNQNICWLQIDKPLTKGQLAELESRLALLSQYDVAQTYRRAHQRCYMQGELLPRAEAGARAGGSLESHAEVETDGAAASGLSPGRAGEPGE